MSPAKTSGTRERILVIAREQFARKGFTGTSIADIARELGTTTAALYYHFGSKADILAALLEPPMAAYRQIIASLDSGAPSAEDLLSAFIDLAVDSREMATIVDRDPTVLAMIDERLPRTSAQMTDEVIAALAGPGTGRAGRLRAHAAFAAIKEATMAAMASPGEGGTLDPADRAEILAAALRALRPQPGN